jgi:GDPmannose 4,6-dehydratase
VFAYWATVNYRESYGLSASNGILFNHESPRRGETFVTRKITRAVAAIKLGLQKELFLGNLDAKRDWGYAPEYVEGMWRIVQEDAGADFVLATNETHTVQEFVETAFARADLDWKEYVKHDERYERPAEVDLLIGDASKAKKILGWEPKVRFQELVRIMVDADLQLLSRTSAREQLGKLP